MGDNLVAERAPFTFSSDRSKEEIREVPFCYRPNLIAAIADTVERHERYNMTKILKFVHKNNFNALIT